MTAGSEPPAGTRPVPRRAWQRMSAAWRSGPLAVRSFRLLTGGQLASTAGDFCYAVALPWLVLSTHGGPVLLGTVLACYGVPRTVVIPLAGVLTDKIGARTLMLMADVVRCVLVAVMAVVATRHIVSLAALGPLAALIGAGEGLYIPASYTIMPSLLEPRQLAAGNGVNLAAIRAGSRPRSRRNLPSGTSTVTGRCPSANSAGWSPTSGSKARPRAPWRRSIGSSEGRTRRGAMPPSPVTI